MSIYYLIVFFLFIGSLLTQFPLVNRQLTLLKVLVVLVISIIGAMRYKVGYDWNSYNSLFNDINTINDVFESRAEKLFLFFLLCSKEIVNNFSFFVALFFLFSFLLKLFLIKRLSSDFFISLLIYVTTVLLIYDFNGIRQGMALSLTMVSFLFVLQRNLFLYLVILSTAIMFHTSAIIFLPFYWVSKFKISQKYVILILICSILLSYPFSYYLLGNSNFQLIMSLETLSHYGSYLQEGSEINKSVSVFSVSLLQRVFILALFIYNFDKVKVKFELKNMLLNAYFFGLIIFIFLMFNAEFSARLSYYFKISEIIFVPFIVTAQVKIGNKILMVFSLTILYSLGLFRILSMEDNGLIPYDFFPFFN